MAKYLPDWTTFLQVRNVRKIEYSLLTRTVDCMPPPPLTEMAPTFFIIDVLYDDAFGHWHAESAVFLHYWKVLTQNFPDLYLLLNKDRVYKRLALKAYDIPEERVLFGGVSSLPLENLCIFPPLLLLNDLSIDLLPFSALWSSHILFLYEKAGLNTSAVSKRIEILALPRQIRENYKLNDRVIPGFVEFCKEVEQRIGGYVLHTDEVADLLEQIRIVASSQIIVLDYGSSFLVNGSLANNSLLLVVNGTLAPFPALEEQCRWMRSRGNHIVYVATLTEASKWLATHEEVSRVR